MQPIALAQVKASKTSENLPNEITHIIYFSHRAKEITKKVFNNIMNSRKLQNRMDTIFMNSKNSKISNPHRLLFNFSDNINLKKSFKYVVLSNLILYILYMENIKSHAKTINLKHQLRRGMKNFDYLTDHILYQILKIILNMS